MHLFELEKRAFKSGKLYIQKAMPNEVVFHVRNSHVSTEKFLCAHILQTNQKRINIFECISIVV